MKKNIILIKNDPFKNYKKDYGNNNIKINNNKDFSKKITTRYSYNSHNRVNQNNLNEKLYENYVKKNLSPNTNYFKKKNYIYNQISKSPRKLNKYEKLYFEENENIKKNTYLNSNNFMKKNYSSNRLNFRKNINYKEKIPKKFKYDQNHKIKIPEIKKIEKNTVNESFKYLQQSSIKIEKEKKELEFNFKKIKDGRKILHSNTSLDHLFEQRRLLDEKNKKLQNEFKDLNLKLKKKEKKRKSSKKINLDKEVENLLSKMESYREQISKLKNKFNNIFSVEENLLNKLSKNNSKKNLIQKKNYKYGDLDKNRDLKKKKYKKDLTRFKKNNISFGLDSDLFPKEISKIDHIKKNSKRFEESLENFFNNKNIKNEKINQEFWNTPNQTFNNSSFKKYPANISDLLNNISKTSEDKSSKNFIVDPRNINNKESMMSSFFKPKLIGSFSLTVKDENIFQ